LLISALAAPTAHADEKAELQQLRATTLALIEALVAQGLLSRERADALVRQAAPPAVAAAPAAPQAAAAVPPDNGAKGNVVRIPYIPQTTRNEIRDEVKLEVLTQAREEGWADPRQVPAWVKALTVHGDIRVRYQYDQFGEDNLPAEFYRLQTATPAWSPDVINTTTDRSRLTLRARLGVGAKISQDLSAAIGIGTGNTNGPTSTSQSLGSFFNKYSLGIDTAFLRYEPRYNLRVIGGRMPNPFYGSDLLWPDDLRFDGVVAQGEYDLAPGIYSFATLGAFPLQTFSTGGNGKWLGALQLGAAGAWGANTLWRLGLAYFDFRGIAGVQETQPPPGGALAGLGEYLSSEYPASARLRGNTLMNINDPTSTADPVWGLASKFRPINLTAGLTFRQFDPVAVDLRVDYVKNSAFDLPDIQQRSGVPDLQLAEQTSGAQLRLVVGNELLAEAGAWQMLLALRRFERDAWLDAFTDTSWNGGGTNYSGWSLGARYAFDRNAYVGLRWTSTRNLSDGSNDLSSAPFKLNTLQLDVNAGF
jgi:hypothetical protein